MLQLESISSYHDRSHILFDLSLEVEGGHSVCLLRRNGVGKSTTMRGIMGVLSPKAHATTEGKVMSNRQSICGLDSHKIVQVGTAYVPQGRYISPTLTTKGSLLIAERVGVDGRKDWMLEGVYDLFPKLRERETSRGGELSGGEQQILTVTRRLIQSPKLLLMDEITEGSAPVIVQQLVKIAQESTRQKVMILLTEQSIKSALSVSEDCYILERGLMVYHEPTKDLTQKMIQKYLGTWWMWVLQARERHRCQRSGWC